MNRGERLSHEPVMLAVLCVLTIPAMAAPVRWSGNGHYYERIDTDPYILWSDAKMAAESRTYLGNVGYLATITSQAENDWITNTLLLSAPGPYYHLGGYQPPGTPEPSGGWEWITGETWDYTNWSSWPQQEPNDVGNEDGLMIFGVVSVDPRGIGKWNDIQQGQGHYLAGYIVEYTPSNQSTAEFFAVLAGVPDGSRRGDLDVQAIRDALLRFPGVKPENIRMVLQDDGSLLQELRSVTGNLRPGDSLLFYYAGHGGFVNLGDEPIVQTTLQAQLLDHAPAINNGDESLSKPAMQDDLLAAELGIGSDHRLARVQKLVILDACYSGGFWGGQDEGDLERVSNCAMMTAASDGDISFYFLPNGRGYLSMALEGSLDFLALHMQVLFSFNDLLAQLGTRYQVSNFSGPAMVGEPHRTETDDGIPIDQVSFSLQSNTGMGFDPTTSIMKPQLGVVAADFDRDMDVDQDDYAVFRACSSGPALPHDGSDTCRQVDLDGDGDVDQSDFGFFQRCISGERNPGDPNCAN